MTYRIKDVGDVACKLAYGKDRGVLKDQNLSVTVLCELRQRANTHPSSS